MSDLPPQRPKPPDDPQLEDASGPPVYRSFGAASSTSMFEPAVSTSSTNYTKDTTTPEALLSAPATTSDVEFASEPDLASVSWRSLAATMAPGGSPGGDAGASASAPAVMRSLAVGAAPGNAGSWGSVPGAPSSLGLKAHANDMQVGAATATATATATSTAATSGTLRAATQPVAAHTHLPADSFSFFQPTPEGTNTTAFSDTPLGAPPPDAIIPPTFDTAWRNMSQMHFPVSRRRGGDSNDGGDITREALHVLRSLRAAFDRCACREWHGGGATSAGGSAPFSWRVQAIHSMHGYEVMQCVAGVYLMGGALTVIFQHVEGSIDAFNRVAHTVVQHCDSVENYPLPL